MNSKDFNLKIILTSKQLQALDESNTAAFLIFVASAHLHFFWTNQKHKMTEMSRFSDHFSLVVLIACLSFTLIGGCMFMMKFFYFVARRGRVNYLKTRIQSFFSEEISDSKFLSMVYVLIGVVSVGLPIKMLMFLPLLAYLFSLGSMTMLILILKLGKNSNK